MNWQSWIFWGIAATLAQTLFDGAMQGLHLTRMSLPFLMGTMFAQERSKARILGLGLHVLNGLVFALPYIAAFHFVGGPTWWRGLLLGLMQGSFVLVIGMKYLPDLHPHMASETAGPTAQRRLEPPGFLALNYGAKTPIAVLLSHAIYGVIIGSFCNA